MGRWAQAKRRGGSVTPLNFMIQAAVGPNNEALITYQRAISSTIFPVDSFLTQPGGIESTTIVQEGTREIRVTFQGVISGETDVEYGGSAQGLQPGQIIPLT